jgi:hypothetical protein
MRLPGCEPYALEEIRMCIASNGKQWPQSLCYTTTRDSVRLDPYVIGPGGLVSL